MDFWDKSQQDCHICIIWVHRKSLRNNMVFWEMDNDDLRICESSQRENHIKTNYTKKNPNFFEIDKTLNDYIANNSKKYRLFLIKCDFELVFNDDFSFHIGTDFYQNRHPFNLKRYLLYDIEVFINKGYIFSNIDEMNRLIANDRMFMTHDFYLLHPKSMLEWKLNVILARNPNLFKFT